MDNAITFKVPLYLMVIVSRGMYSSNSSISSTCESITVTEGLSTTLTCTFGDDVNNVRKNVYVDHRRINDSKHALVVSCQWTSNGYYCKTIPGYCPVGKVTKTLSVEIPNIQEAHAGKYWCEIFGSDPRDRTICEISVIGAITTYDETTYRNIQTSASCKDVGLDSPRTVQGLYTHDDILDDLEDTKPGVGSNRIFQRDPLKCICVVKAIVKVSEVMFLCVKTFQDLLSKTLSFNVKLYDPCDPAATFSIVYNSSHSA